VLILLLFLVLVKLLTMFETQANVGELARLSWYFSFSHQCSWTFESSGMWCRVNGRMVHGVSTDRNAFIFRVKNSFFDGLCRKWRPYDATKRRALLVQRHCITSQKIWVFTHLRVVFAYKNLRLIFVSIHNSRVCNFLSTKWIWLSRSVQTLRFFLCQWRFEMTAQLATRVCSYYFYWVSCFSYTRVYAGATDHCCCCIRLFVLMSPFCRVSKFVNFDVRVFDICDRFFF